MEEVYTSQEVPGNISLNISTAEIKSLAGWAKFTAIVSIIFGAITCLGIITAALGIPQIIAATKLLNACSSLDRYAASNDINSISNALSGFNKYFKINGIVLIIQIILSLIGIIAYGAIFAVLLQEMGNGSVPNF